MNTQNCSTESFEFQNTYVHLPDRFYTRLNPTPVAAPTLLRLNDNLAQHLNLDPAMFSSPAGVDVLAGNAIPHGAQPLAMVYAGHQFGNWVPQLGDGRAVLLGEVTGEDNIRYDIQLKGAGPTPYSRNGDGRACLGPVLREYIVSEAMWALGVPTTRALAAIQTGEIVRRERLIPGAILTRVARSHVRVGTFQYFAAQRDTDALRQLAEYVIARHYPDVSAAANPALALLDKVMTSQAELIAKWQLIGFIHGVMNTDNMSVSGDTIDYGPCAFMDDYHPDKVFSSIDQMGRYAYKNQPAIGHWNLANLAQSLVPIIDDDARLALEFAQAALTEYPGRFANAYLQGMRAKLGLTSAQDTDLHLANALLQCMAAEQADFTLCFRRLSELDYNNAAQNAAADAAFLSLFKDTEAITNWLEQWRQRLAVEASEDSARQRLMRAHNPAYIPRNHRIESVIAAAENERDFSPFDQIMQVLANPYDDQPNFAQFQDPPTAEQVVRHTFCGT